MQKILPTCGVAGKISISNYYFQKYNVNDIKKQTRKGRQGAECALTVALIT